MKDVSFDAGRKYSVPWLSGMTAIGYNPKKTKRELTSVNDIFDPKFKGQVTMLTEMRDTLGLVMLGMGKDPAYGHAGRRQGRRRQDQEGPGERADQEVHRQRLRRGPGGGKHRGGVRLVGRHPGTPGRQPRPAVDRTDGRRHAVLRQHDDPQDLRPADGGDELDQLRLRSQAFGPDRGGRPYVSAAKGADEELAKIAPDLAKSPLVNPPPEWRARLHVFRALSDEEETEFNRIFQDAIGA